MEFICQDCGKKFFKETKKGRHPKRCPACREEIKSNWRQNKENR